MQNNDPGLRNLDITLNGERFKERGLGDNEETTVDVASAMAASDNNTFTLEAKGKPGASALVKIHAQK